MWWEGKGRAISLHRTKEFKLLDCPTELVRGCLKLLGLLSELFEPMDESGEEPKDGIKDIL